MGLHALDVHHRQRIGCTLELHHEIVRLNHRTVPGGLGPRPGQHLEASKCTSLWYSKHRMHFAYADLLDQTQGSAQPNLKPFLFLLVTT